MALHIYVSVYVNVGLSYVTPYVPKRGRQSKALEDPSSNVLETWMLSVR